MWTFCGPRRKAMRTPGRIVFGSTVNSARFCLSSATTASLPSTRSPICSSSRWGGSGGWSTASGSVGCRRPPVHAKGRLWVAAFAGMMMMMMNGAGTKG